MANYSVGSFKSLPVLGEMLDPYRGRTLRAHYIGRDDAVGIHDGIDSWVCTIGAGCYAMKLEEKIAAYKAGTLTVVRQRKRLDDGDPEPELIIRRRVPIRRRIHVD